MNDLINNLVSDLRPVKKIWTPKKRTMVFFVIQLITIFTFMWIRIPFSNNLLQLNSPLIALQFLFFLLTVLCTLFFTFKKIIPGQHSNRIIYIFPLVSLVCLIISSYFLSGEVMILFPDKRGYCEVEIILLTIIPLSHLGYLIKKGFLFDKELLMTTLIAGTLIPAGIMHIACKFNPTHALLYHLGPVFLITVVSLIVFILKDKIKH